MKIRVLITGRSYDAMENFPDELDLPADATVDDALDEIKRQLPNQDLPDSCLVVQSGKHLGTAATHESPTLRDGDELMLIAPVAGG